MTKVRLSLSVDDSYLSKIGEVEQAAKKVGLKNAEVLDGLGILKGSIEKDKVGQLHQIEGVSYVEEERTVSISPKRP